MKLTGELGEPKRFYEEMTDRMLRAAYGVAVGAGHATAAALLAEIKYRGLEL